MTIALQSDTDDSLNDMIIEYVEDNIIPDEFYDRDHSQPSTLLAKVPPTGISSVQLFEKIHQFNQMETLTNIRKHLAFVACVASLELK